MSRGARWTIAIAAVLGAFAIVLPQPRPTKSPIATVGIVAFLGLVVIACLSEKARPMALRFLGGSVFLLYAYYFYSEFIGPDKPWRSTSSPHWINALLGGVVFGLPGLYVALFGRFPRWGFGAAAFRGSDNQQDSCELEDRYRED